MDNVASQPLQLRHVQNELFREAIQRHVEVYIAHFRERLEAIYVSGSVHRNEAVPGLSDLDLHPFITDDISDGDQEWWQRARKTMDQEFGKIHGLCRPRRVASELIQGMQAASRKWYAIVADPVDGTLRGQPGPDERKASQARMYGLMLRYDATLVWGNDLLFGYHVPLPERQDAEIFILSPWELTRYAGGLARENRTDFDLPDEPRLRLHELAKLAKLGGIALLMARGRFRSFRATDVLPELSRLLPDWSSFMERSRECYFPMAAPTSEEVSAYLRGLVPWMEWVGAELHGNSSQGGEVVAHHCTVQDSQ